MVRWKPQISHEETNDFKIQRRKYKINTISKLLRILIFAKVRMISSIIIWMMKCVYLVTVIFFRINSLACSRTKSIDTPYLSTLVGTA